MEAFDPSLDKLRLALRENRQKFEKIRGLHEAFGSFLYISDEKLALLEFKAVLRNLDRCCGIVGSGLGDEDYDKFFNELVDMGKIGSFRLEGFFRTVWVSALFHLLLY
jgi:hypothetical protein